MSVAADADTRQAVDIRRVAMWVLALVMPVETFRVIAEVGGTAPGYNRVAVITFFDLPLLILAIAAIPEARRRLRERDLSLGVITALVVAAMAALALIFHPSWRGVHVVVRLLAGALVVFEITRLDRAQLRYRLVGPLLISGSIQGVLAVLQAANGGPLGVGFGELGELYVFGSTTAGSGTALHPYVLAAFASLVTTVGLAVGPPPARSAPWLAGIALSAASLGVTFARSAVAGLVFGIAALAVAIARGDRRYRASFAAFVGGLLIPAVVFSGGWVDRVESSTTGDLESFSTGRVTHIEQALDVIGDSPLIGVGPGLYSEALEARHDPKFPDAVHAVPLLIAAEDGIYAGFVYLVLMLALALRAWRTSPAAFAVVTSLAGFMAFDKLTYLHPNGIVMFAIWLGILDHLARDEVPEAASVSS